MSQIRLIKESQSALEQLHQLIADKDAIALVGSGLSVEAGFPTWNVLLDELHKHLGKAKPNAKPGSEVGGKGGRYLGRLRRMPDTLWRAQEYRRLLGDAEFFGALGRVFIRRSLPDHSALHQLTALGFRHYLTTNYDDLLEQALAARQLPFETLVWGKEHATGAAARFVRDLSDDNAARRIVYLHGRYDDLPNCVLAEGDYFKRYVASDETHRRLFAVFLTRSVLFVGFSMSDPELSHLLRVVRGYFQDVKPWHYAIMPLPAGERVEVATAFYQYRYGLTPIFYAPSPDHEGLLEVLDLLRGGDVPDPTPARNGSTPRSSASSEAHPKTPSARPDGRESRIRELPVEDPDDPNKGRFGGKAEVGGWKLSAEVSNADNPDWFYVELVVTAPSGQASQKRSVLFHLHPTFEPPSQEADVSASGVAEMDVYAYGAFTVGVEAEDGTVRLELDLAELPGAPKAFRMR